MQSGCKLCFAYDRTIGSEPYDFPRLEKLVTKFEQSQTVSRVVSSGVGLVLMAFTTVLAD